jgi:hypothetical protein
LARNNSHCGETATAVKTGSSEDRSIPSGRARTAASSAAGRGTYRLRQPGRHPPPHPRQAEGEARRMRPAGEHRKSESSKDAARTGRLQLPVQACPLLCGRTIVRRAGQYRAVGLAGRSVRVPGVKHGPGNPGARIPGRRAR